MCTYFQRANLPIVRKNMVGVEAAALSAAVTGTLKIVGNKLAPLILKEYSSIVGVKKDLGELKELAEEINCWLENGEEGRGAMEGAKSLNWLKRLKDIANTVDDVVDEFQLETEKLDMNGGGGIVSKHLIKKTNSFRVQCKAAHKIKAVKKRFAVIVKQRTDLTAIVGHNPIRHLNKATVDMPTLPVINEAAVLGRGQDKNKIITKLLKANVQQELEVVSIIGLGGAGKTTLAKLVFNDCKIIKKHFEVRLWVHVSQEFNMEKLVEKLFEAVTKDKSDHYSLHYMSEKISKELTGKNFLLVLDDVWIEDRSQHVQLQEEFMVHLKSGKSRSKILVTTRNRRVAEVMESTELYDLPFLSLDDSWQLFNRSFGPGLKELGYEYQQIGKDIVGKCGGVPLAIKVLAGTLRDKKLVGEWEAMRDNNLLDVEGEKSIWACLKLSYFCLPSHLKQCFTLCSLFPKGHAIYKEQLIDLWIAHNMIGLTIGVDYLEDIGNMYFNSLVQVSFLHDVDEYDGRLRCKMHDLVHNLARSISCEEFSIGVPMSMKGYIYFCLTNIQQPRESLPKKVFHKARAMYVDNGDYIIFHEALKNAKHWHSVIVNHISSMDMLISIFQVKNLKYLEMSLLQCEALPEAISDIWSLEAVHLRYSGLIELPKSIGNLQKLRTLNLSSCWKLKCLPDSIGDCNSLSSIDLFSCRELTALPNSIGKLQKLKTLSLSHCAKLKYLPDSFGDSNMLSSIDLFNCGELTTLPNSIGKLKKLRMLNLSQCAKLMCLPDSIGDCNMLSRIGLFNCGRLIALPHSIAKLQKIKSLGLSHCAKLKCLPDSFGDSSMLSSINLFNCGELTSLPNSIGMLQKLETLNLLQCAKLKCLPDSIGDCTMLSSIDLYNCREVTTLPNSVGKLQKLRMLRILHCTKVECLPDSIGDCNMLPNLDLCNFGDLTTLPNSIGKLQKLRTLNLSQCAKLKCLPDSFGDSNLLSSIDLFNCGELTTLPNSIGKLQKLRMLNLSHCAKMKHLPDSIGDCIMLSSIDLFYCKELTTLPNSIGNLHKFKTLNLSHCAKLEYLPDSFSDSNMLSSIDLFNCGELITLPNSIDKLQKLRTLNLSNCAKLACLPDSIGNCNMLSSIGLFNCGGLTTLPNSIGKLQKIKTLNLSHCAKLKCLPDSFGDSNLLSSIDLFNCGELTSLPNSLGNLQKLETLNLSQCAKLKCSPFSSGDSDVLSNNDLLNREDLTALPYSIGKLQRLRTLNLSQCAKLTCLPDSIGDCNMLIFLIVGSL
ncbi:hypothetical protein BS78_05G026000 [Paspalum vaginatum]|nr:hypothetical protein BS78_05G026000 [Paspalum vaginatum]